MKSYYQITLICLFFVCSSVFGQMEDDGKYFSLTSKTPPKVGAIIEHPAVLFKPGDLTPNEANFVIVNSFSKFTKKNPNMIFEVMAFSLHKKPNPKHAENAQTRLDNVIYMLTQKQGVRPSQLKPVLVKNFLKYPFVTEFIDPRGNNVLNDLVIFRFKGYKKATTN